MPKSKSDSQRQKLVRAEHMFEADRDEAAFEKRLKKIAKQKPKRAKSKRR
jgi:hypothetical protein